VLITAVTAAAFGTNCWVVAPGPRGDCIIVDPGIGVLDSLRDVLVTERLRPSAILLTHGHADHVWSVVGVCGTADPPPAVYLHPDDAYRLVDPLAMLDESLVAMLAAQFPREATWQRPADVVEIGDSRPIETAGLVIEVSHSPGHTEGSVVFGLDGGADQPVLLSGDLLFAGSIGRSDLPGGDPARLVESLRQVMAAHQDETRVLPGHGPVTTIGAERVGNPYVRAALASARGRGRS